MPCGRCAKAGGRKTERVIDDQTILDCLNAAFGLRADRLAFLPLGGDLGTAVYRAAEPGGTAYFCKLRREDFAEIAVELPEYLRRQGIAQIIAPLETGAGRLWAELGDYRVILYPFMEGRSGFDQALTGRQWAEFGAALRRIHTTPLPEGLAAKLEREDFSPRRREAVREKMGWIEQGRLPLEDAFTRRWAEFLAPQREKVLDLAARAETLARALAARPPEFTLCHADIHPGNLFLADTGELYIVDWDYPALAPKERDLMFVGGGQGYVGVTAEEEEAFFYPHYWGNENGAAANPAALAYYRCERNLIDLLVETARIFSPDLNDTDREFSLQIVSWLFEPGGSVERAYVALDAL